MQPRKATLVEALIDAAVRGRLTKAQALRLYRQGPEVVTWALLAASKRIAGLQTQANGTVPSPSTPSGMVPIYTKPNAPKRRKKPGAQKGHLGHRRQRPKRINARRKHRSQKFSGA